MLLKLQNYDYMISTLIRDIWLPYNSLVPQR